MQSGYSGARLLCFNPISVTSSPQNLSRLPYLSFCMYNMRIVLPMNKISMSLSYELINMMDLDILEESKFSTNVY